MEGLGGKVMGFFWAHAWFVQCPWDLGCRGPGFLGLFLGVQMGLRGAMQWVFWAHAWFVPSWGYTLSILWYGSNPSGRKVHIFLNIILKELFFRTIFSMDWCTLAAVTKYINLLVVILFSSILEYMIPFTEVTCFKKCFFMILFLNFWVFFLVSVIALWTTVARTY